MTDAAIMTARMISITSIGGLVGVWPNTYVSTKTPKLPHNPRPTPPYRLPIKMHASTTANSRQLTKVSIDHSFPYPPAPPDAKRRDASALPQDAWRYHFHPIATILRLRKAICVASGRSFGHTSWQPSSDRQPKTP